MDTNKMREQFEDWASAQFVMPVEVIKECRYEGTYANTVLNIAWRGWEASREAVVVELPEPDLPEAYADEPVDRESEEFRYLEARHGAQSQTYRKCRQAIEAQGLKVAP